MNVLKSYFYLNTSHVNVNPEMENLKSTVSENLNTSHVNVNLKNQ